MAEQPDPCQVLKRAYDPALEAFRLDDVSPASGATHTLDACEALQKVAEVTDTEMRAVSV